jgi:hypothetical protein
MNQPAGPSTYLTTEELAALIKYDVRTIRNRLKDSVLFEGVHYIRPFGGRKILFLREAIERDIGGATSVAADAGGGVKIDTSDAARSTSRRKPKDIDMIPMAGGGICHV